MHFDIATVPFSRSGSYLAISRLPEITGRAEGVYLRTVHGDARRQDVFHIELLADGKPVAFKETTDPAKLRLDARQGFAQFCWETPQSLRLQAKGVQVRLTLVDTAQTGYAMPAEESRWLVNSCLHRLNFAFTPFQGKLQTDAPWETHRCRHVHLTFQPDNRGGALLEGAIEAFLSVAPPLTRRPTFEECVREVEREFEAWRRRSPALPDTLEETGELAAYVNWSAIVAPAGHLSRPAMLMSKNVMPKVWSWDHCFNAIALGYHNPDLAWDQLLVPFDHQDSFGALPETVNDTEIIRNFVKPPIHGWALRRLMNHSDAPTPRRLREFYEPLSHWTNWWMEHRDGDRDGMPHYQHGNDSGWDNATSCDIGMPLESPDLATFLVLQMDVLAEIATRLGKKRDTHRWQKRSDQLLEKLMAHNWNGAAFTAPRGGDHKVATGGDTLIVFMPLLLGKRLPPDIRQKLTSAIATEGRFLTKYGLATESIKSKKYESDGHWRGPIWAPSTLLIVDGLNQCGETALAREIAGRFCKTVTLSGMAENFDAQTGKGLRDPAYTWTSSVFQVLGHEYLRTRH